MLHAERPGELWQNFVGDENDRRPFAEHVPCQFGGRLHEWLKRYSPIVLKAALRLNLIADPIGISC